MRGTGILLGPAGLSASPVLGYYLHIPIDRRPNQFALTRMSPDYSFLVQGDALDDAATAASSPSRSKTIPNERAPTDLSASLL